MKLDNKQIHQFKTTGFLVIRKLYEPEKMKVIAEWARELENYPEVPAKYMMYFEESKLKPGNRILSRIENIEPYHQGFSELFLHGKMQKIASWLLGDEALLFKDKINFKMLGGDGFRAHQDAQAGWDCYGKLHITALLSIDPATVENGCLEVVSAHHDKDLIGKSWEPLEEEELNYQTVPTEPGDAIFFSSYTPHRSKPNMTDKYRRVLYITYNASSEGDQRQQYYRDKQLNYPPDIERKPDKKYIFRV